MRLFLRALGLCVIGAAVSAISVTFLAHLPYGVALQVQDESQEITVRHMVTFGSTVRDVLHEAGVNVGRHDRLAPALGTALAPGLVIEVRRAFPVTLHVDGYRRVVMTAAVTVDEFIGNPATSLALRPRDRVHPSTSSPLGPGDQVRVIRIDTRIIQQPEPVPFARVAKHDPTLPRGMTRIAQRGRPGVRMRRLAITTADGVVVQRRELASVLAVPPQDHVLQIGMRRIIASRGEFEGKEMIHMEATAYAPWHGKGVNDITAIGLKATYGVVAVDPTIIPLRSVVFIEGYGRAIAGDTGGAIKGHRIDLCYDTVSEAIRFGRRPVRVYILSTPPQRRR
jgi:uncharacterized protein YabE (DUF348 family)